MFANGTTGSYTPYKSSFINDLILAVRSLDRAFQITCRTIMNCICSESAHRDTLTARVMACRCEEERRVCRAHRASFPLSLPSLPPLLSNMLGMLLPNIPSAKWSVKIPAGPSDFTPSARVLFPLFPYARRSKRTDSVSSWREPGDR